MDENDLQCIDKLANLVRDVLRSNPHGVRRASIAWQVPEGFDTYVPFLEIEMGFPEAKAAD